MEACVREIHIWKNVMMFIHALQHHLIDKKQTFEKFPVAVTTGVVVLK